MPINALLGQTCHDATSSIVSLPTFYISSTKASSRITLSKWSTKAADATKTEVDHRYMAIPQHPDLHHFKKGILLVMQWTGTEYKNMEKVFLGHAGRNGQTWCHHLCSCSTWFYLLFPPGTTHGWVIEEAWRLITHLPCPQTHIYWRWCLWALQYP